MPTFDGPATAHLDSGDATKPIFLIWLDVDGYPMRAKTAAHPITLPVLDDPDLSEQTFSPTIGILDVGDVTYSESGSETVAITLSGLILPDADVLEEMGDRSQWQGRLCRLWVILRNEARVQQGGVANYYTGYMSSLKIVPSPDDQKIMLEVEGYKALLSAASGRSYLDQKRYDAADTSAGATIGAANGATAGLSSIPGFPASPGNTPRLQYDSPFE